MSSLSRSIAEIRDRVDAVSQETRDSLNADLDLTFTEHFAWQEAQAQAHASGRLTTADATIIYRAVGEVGSQSNGGWASGTDLATKVAVTLAMGEIISARMMGDALRTGKQEV